jgi:membrane fusion protein, multidrug efflux system
MDVMTPDTVVTRSRSRTRRWVMLVPCVLVAAAIVWTIWFFPHGTQKSTDRDQTGQPIPVVTAEAQTKDVPIYLDGLGTVQAFYTVTMKPMVDGPLIAVNFQEGQDVHKGDVLAQIDPRTYQAALDSAVAKKAQDQSLLANSRLDLVRYQKLVSNNYTSAQQADTQKAVVAQNEALVQQDQAAIDTARTNLSYTTITAPIDGRTGIRQVDAGNIVHASDTTGIVVLTQIQPISVLFTLPQQTLGAVTQAMADGKAPVLAIEQNPAGGTPRTLDTGTLTVLDNQVDQTTGTIKLKATFPNAQRKLWPGGFVGIRLRTEVAKDAIVVPPSAIQRGPQGPYVFTVTDNTAHRVPVTTGFEDQTASIVAIGLKAGDRVVLDGASRLSDGSKVSIGAPPARGPTTAEPTAAPGTRPRR